MFHNWKMGIKYFIYVVWFLMFTAQASFASVYTVINTNDTGTGSLREAIVNANAHIGTDKIEFNIPTSDPGYSPTTGAFTIQPTFALPTITDPLIIDGYTQPGAAPATENTNATLKIELDGTNAGSSTIGLKITGGNSTVRGLVINRFNGSSQSSAIKLNGTGGNVIEGNYIGTDVTGTIALTNAKLASISYPGFGIVIYSSSGNTIGGTAPGSGNLISGNQRGIVIEGASATGNLVQGNYIGTDVTGTVALGNGWWQDYYGTVMYFGSYGVCVHASNNTIGGTTVGAQNIISGNGTGIGIYASDNIVQGNYIGTDKTGTAVLGNSVNGIRIVSYGQSLVGNIIGGTTADARNIISGNGQEPGFSGYEAAAVYIRIEGGLNASGTIVQGNYIGTDKTGTIALANKIGVKVVNWNIYGGNFGITIGGTTAGSRNIISGNTSHGISIAGAVSTTTIQGNYIGTDVTGSMSLGNSSGVVLTPTAAAVGPTNNTIGGTTVGTGNVVSGNQKYGIYISESDLNQIQCNLIGTDATGTLSLGNGIDGITIENGVGNTIGGTTNGSRNLVSGNTRVGILISGSSATDNKVQGNFIGTDISGTSSVSNGNNGVRIDGGSDNAIGGVDSGAGNIIAFNSAAGVLVTSGTGNCIRNNSIFSNACLGIDLHPIGVTSNDLGDGDTGPNDLQNFPVLTSTTSSSDNITIDGTLNSIANTEFMLEFFSNTTANPSGNGEGETFLGFASRNTDVSGNVSFTVTLPTKVSRDQFITATATDPNYNTSEFSKYVEVLKYLVNIDIKPQSCPNPLNIKSRGALPVAILGTQDFDVNDVDPSTVQLEGVDVEQWDFEDVSRPVVNGDECDCTTEGADGYIDLTLKFNTQEIVDALGDVEDGDVVVLTLTGILTDNTLIEGTDCVVIQAKCKGEAITNENKIESIPTAYRLKNNYPNPFKSSTIIRYELPEPAQVTITIYDLMGRKVRTLINNTQDAGYKSVIWDARDEFGRHVSTGVYLYKMQAGQFTQTRKMLLMK